MCLFIIHFRESTLIKSIFNPNSKFFISETLPWPLLKFDIVFQALTLIIIFFKTERTSLSLSKLIARMVIKYLKGLEKQCQSLETVTVTFQKWKIYCNKEKKWHFLIHEYNKNYIHYYSSVDNHFSSKKAHELISEYLQSFFKKGFIWAL